MYMINKNGFLYKYVYNGIEKAYFCVTHHSEKADDTFSKSFDFYEKEVPLTEACVEDIYNINFYVYWDCGIDNVSDKWEVPASKIWVDGEKLKLEHDGHLPGWNIDDKHLCSKYVNMSEIEQYAIEYKYLVKDGVKLEQEFVDGRIVSRQEFEALFETHLNENI